MAVPPISALEGDKLRGWVEKLCARMPVVTFLLGELGPDMARFWSMGTHNH
jgi:hypothetical protein